MRDFTSIEEMAQFTSAKLDNKISTGDISAFWSHTAKLVQRNNRSRMGRSQPNRQQQQELADQLKYIFLHTIKELQTFRPRDLATTALGFAKIANAVTSHEGNHRKTHQQIILQNLLIGRNPKQQQVIYQAIANASMPLLREFEPRYLSNLAYANAIVGSVPMMGDGNSLFHHLAERSIPLLQKFNAQDLSNMVWSFEKAEESHPVLFKKVADHIIALDDLEEFDTQHVANISWAFAKAEESNPRLFQKVADHIVAFDHLGDFSSQNFANIVWAFAKAEEPSPRLFQKVADHIVALDDLEKFDPQHITNTVWAFAKAKESHPQLFQKVADHILSLDNLQPYIVRNCSQLLWGYATARIINLPLFRKVHDHVEANFDFKSLDERDQRNLLGAYEMAEKARAEAASEKKKDLEQKNAKENSNKQELSSDRKGAETAEQASTKKDK